MAFDPETVRTVTFDSYSTLVDVDAAEAALADRVPEPEPVSKLWRSRSLAYTFVATQIDAYQPFYEVNRDALQYALDANGVALSESERDEILAVYHELDVFDDVRDGLARLVEAGYDCYVVSNGDPEMLASMVEHADIGDLVSDTVSADEIETFKPAADLYRHAAARTGTPIAELVLDEVGEFRDPLEALVVRGFARHRQEFLGRGREVLVGELRSPRVRAVDGFDVVLGGDGDREFQRAPELEPGGLGVALLCPVDFGLVDVLARVAASERAGTSASWSVVSTSRSRISMSSGASRTCCALAATRRTTL